ncbi:hypothetical protein CI105_00550 [Candidatus Izimaplasma bacterium ZiA1]|uniref:sulfite exporter TauE/SafE family protein n=1 Tax=Candidatus Izimoplasma sp. ZiA1 TaxID=2024899 RepID=UPI000BAA9469|nr:hypothetical protein CI105_00550 [Candidatus Izimaplasma bacterium ZiA1]
MINLILIAGIAIFAGFIKGSSGFGSSLVALPLLSLFYPIEDVVIIMITLNVVLNFLMLFEYKTISFNRDKRILVIITFGVICTFLGFQLADYLDEKVIKYIAAFLILLAILNKTSRFSFTIKDNFVFQAITGSLSGLFNGIASIDGPPVVFYLTSIKADKAQFKHTLVSYFFVLALLSVSMLVISGNYPINVFYKALFVGVFLVIGLMIGMLVSRRINDKSFSKFVTILLVFLGLSMLI